MGSMRLPLILLLVLTSQVSLAGADTAKRIGTFEEIGADSGFGFDSDGNATGAMGIDAAHYRNDENLAVAIGNEVKRAMRGDLNIDFGNRDSDIARVVWIAKPA